MIKTAYICDRCDKEMEVSEAHNVNLRVTDVVEERLQMRKSQLWCRKCCNESGIANYNFSQKMLDMSVKFLMGRATPKQS